MSAQQSRTKVQIVIPMSGFGERFRRVGYRLPKPLIRVGGKPIVGHVIDLFPGETDFIFICNQDHLDHLEYRMAETLTELCPSGRVVGIPSHKLGPVHAVQQIAHLLDESRPVVVNYSDFSCYWNWPHFLEFVVALDCDGAIPAYRGFHPHSLGKTNYAYMKEAEGWVLDIQEKQPYTEDRMQEYASSGTYYFKSAKKMLAAFAQTVSMNLNVGGEFYVSLAYKPMLTAGDAVAVYELQHFLQWGTPEDLQEYENWSAAFSLLAVKGLPDSRPHGSLVVPMAGLGERFSRAGYTQAKPLIEVSGRPMALQAALDLPAAQSHAFVLRKDMKGHDQIADQLRAAYPDALLPGVPQVTEGQACTAELGLAALANAASLDEGLPVTFGVCDSGVLFDEQCLDALLKEGCADLIVWSKRGHTHAARNPTMYGWIAETDGLIDNVSVKTPLADPATDPIVIGIFTFRNADVFRKCFERMVARDARINGEFYLDTCVNDALALGFKCRVLEVDAYYSWGTPNDLQTFEYWQSCFSKMNSHSYLLERDARVSPEAVTSLEAKYAPVLPGTDAVGSRPATTQSSQ